VACSKGREVDAAGEVTVFIATAAAFYLTLGTFAQTALRTRPAAARTISRTAGAAMIVIGTLLAIDRLTA
jgi:threonine/homoserine/homoserine lactone efflux protein